MKLSIRVLPALSLLVAIAACGETSPPWPYESPVLDLPEGFQPTSSPRPRGREALPGRALETRIAWELHRGGDVSQIVMSRYAGSTSPDEAERARSTLEDNNRSWAFGNLATRILADRPSWAWTATVPSHQGTPWAVERTLLLSFPDSTYVMSFWGQHPEWQDEARMDAVLASFRIRPPDQPLPRHPLVVAGVALLLGLALWVRKARADASLARQRRAAAPIPMPVHRAEEDSAPEVTFVSPVDPATTGASAPPEDEEDPGLAPPARLDEFTIVR